MNMEKRIQKDIREMGGGNVSSMRLIREKAGIYVYRCIYEGKQAVAKFYEREGDRREIGYYRLLQELDVPTIPIYAMGNECLIMEDMACSKEWRMGEDEDMDDPEVLRALAGWYFRLHEAGEKAGSLEKMYSENELLEQDICFLQDRLPDAQTLCRYVRTRANELRAYIRQRENTLTYNDFYYTNLLVSHDKRRAMMFDYNLMGRGYRYSDFRNVDSSVSMEAFQAFQDEYARLYKQKHGKIFFHAAEEVRLGEWLAPLCGLIGALKRERFPGWAESMRDEAINGVLMRKTKEILGEISIEDEIRAYVPTNEQEAYDRLEILRRLASGEELLTRKNCSAHMTASAWVVSPDRRYVLMAYHNQYRSWAWLGGHADGEKDLMAVARREATEESGLRSLRPLSGEMISMEILPVAGHIKHGEYVSEHIHLNATYLFEADMDEPLLSKPDENSQVRWIRIDELSEKINEKWMLERVYKKLCMKVCRMAES